MATVLLTGCSIPLSTDIPPEEIESVKDDVFSSPIWEYLSGLIKGLFTDFKDAVADSISTDTSGVYEEATYVRTVDGDTIVVLLDGKEQKVRLIGVDTPESVASDEYLEKSGKENTQEGKDASEYTKSILSDTSTLYLVKDKTGTDIYGRLLRYVWLEIPEDDMDETEVSEKMLNGILVWEGYANAVSYPPNVKYKEIFEYLEGYRD